MARLRIAGPQSILRTRMKAKTRARRTVRPLALAAALLAAAATVFAANHCELVGRAPASPGHSCCAGNETKPAAPPAGERSDCCIDLAAPQAAATLPAIAPGGIFQVPATLPAPSAPPAPALARACSSGAPPGPPAALSVTLRRSLPALAPPAFVG
jgi:hypothetical protein